MKNFLFFLTPFFVSSYFFIPVYAWAVDTVQAAEVNMAAQVSSPISLENSSVKFNTQKTLADPVNHPLLLTVILLDKDRKPLAGRDVAVTSDRGLVDVIEAISKLPLYQVQAVEISSIQKEKTDIEGKSQFRITSFVPGTAPLNITADTVQLPGQTVVFDPLPFPAEFILSTSFPWTNKEFVIYSTRIQEKNLSVAQVEAKRIANPETKIKLIFWVFALFLLIILGIPVFVLLNFLNLRKIRGMEHEQSLLLKKIFPPDYNRHT